jgi:hypothetical protein
VLAAEEMAASRGVEEAEVEGAEAEVVVEVDMEVDVAVLGVDVLTPGTARTGTFPVPSASVSALPPVPVILAVGTLAAVSLMYAVDSGSV